MKFLKKYLFIIIGAIVLFSANIENLKSPYSYIIGVVLIMYGLFNISKKLKSNSDKEQNNQEE